MAYSATSDLRSVEVSLDGGKTWSAATTKPTGSTFAPVAWEKISVLEPGTYVIAARATEPRWNRNGYGNNVIQRITVTVAGA
jgi:sulfite dehydrogenase